MTLNTSTTDVKKFISVRMSCSTMHTGDLPGKISSKNIANEIYTLIYECGRLI